MSLFNPSNNPRRYYFYLHFIEAENESQKGLATQLKSYDL